MSTPVAELPAGFPWTEYLRALLGREDIPTEVVVEATFVPATAVSAMKLPGARAYERWMCTAHLARHGTEATQKKNWDFFGSRLRGQQAMKPREWRIAEEVASAFPSAVSEAYVREFREELLADRKSIRELAERIRASTLEMISGTKKLSGDCRRLCTRKVLKTKIRAGFPEGPFPGLEEDREAMKLAQTGWLDAVEAARRGQTLRRLRRVGGADLPGDWVDVTPFCLNAFYSPVDNSITVPSAIIRSHVFDLSSEETAVGSAGVVLAHEMSHAFDSEGFHYSPEGVWSTWWPKEDQENFRRLKDEIDAHLEKENVNAKLTDGEFMADLNGIRVALSALPKGADVKKSFEGWAQLWRIKMAEASALERKLADPHLVGALRANTPLRNLKEFLDAFGVKEGDGMFLQENERVSVFWCLRRWVRQLLGAAAAGCEIGRAVG